MSDRSHIASASFVLRTPLLPFETFAALGEGLGAADAEARGAELGEVLADDEARVLARMRALVERAEVREALFVASPSFDRALAGWLSSGSRGSRGAGDDVPVTLVRYLARMAARPTPFGLFAGLSVGRTGAEGTRLALGPLSDYRKHTRLDAGHLVVVAEALEQDASLRDALRFRPSSGLYAAGGRIRLAEGVTKPGSRERSYQLVAVERTPYLDATLARAEHGAREAELADALVADDPEIERDEAGAFVASLVASQILCSDLAPNITGEEAIDGLVDVLRAAGSAGAPAARALEEARATMRALDDAPLGVAPERYHAIAKSLAPLPAEIDMARLFQVDLHKPAPEATLGGPAARLVDDALALVTRIAIPVESEAMRRFREAFGRRYGEGSDGPVGTQRMVPLCEALDDEVGIGFGEGAGEASGRSPLLDGLPFDADKPPAKVELGRREAQLTRGLVETLRAGRVEWALTDADLEALAPKTPATLPDAFAFAGTLAAASPEALARGEGRLLFEFVAGPNGAVMLGRFCHGDPEVRRAVEAHLRAEESLRPDAVYAEIVHLPEGRLGNILARPALRTYEIPYLGQSGVPHERQIPITDLHLTLDRGRLVLFSKRLGREVIPRLTSAHNFSLSRLAIYRFLCSLQRDRERHAFLWAWGPLANAPFLPRVSRGKIILSLARWQLRKEELAPLGGATPVERFRLVQALRRSRGLPRWVVLTEGDRTLPFDLDNVVCVASFGALVAQRDGAVLTEMFPSGDELVAHGPEGRFAHQLLVPFVRRPPVATATAAAATAPAKRPTVARTFPPGSEWLYVKLHAGHASADAVLTDLVAPTIARARRAKAIATWFFHRSAEPRWHVGLALRGDPARLARMLPKLSAAAAPLLEDGRLGSIAVDTYEREIERWGGDEGVELAESLFDADSDAALAILERLESGTGADERWRLALRGCHDLLVDLGLDLARRTDVVRRAREKLAAELRVEKPLEHALGARFRAERASLAALLVAQPESDHPLAPGLALLAERSARVRPIADELRARELAGRLTVAVPDFAAGLLRMHCSRLLRAELRAQELVILEFLERLYVSEAARRKGASS